MTSSSTDPAVVRDLDGAAVRRPALDTDLRSGAWTRLGASAVLGDVATESALHDLAESTRAAARAQGYATGWAQGRAAAEQQAAVARQEQAREDAAERERQAAEHAAAVAGLRQAAQRLDSAVTEAADAVRAHAVEVALQVAEAVLGREVALAADPAGDAVRRALALVPDGAVVTVRLHPQDRAGVDLGALAESGVLGDRVVRLADDPALRRGDAIAESDTSVVDATVAAALDRVREVLAP